MNRCPGLTLADNGILDRMKEEFGSCKKGDKGSIQEKYSEKKHKSEENRK